MAETVIVSPGVFTRENDLSYLPAGIAQIGAAIVGPTVKGPAFVPTLVKSFAEFERKFGPLSKETYVPQTVREYLKNAGSVTITRVLAGGGYKFTNGTNEIVGLAVSGASGNVLLSAFFPSKNASSTIDLSTTTLSMSTPNALMSSFALDFNGTGFATSKKFSASLSPSNIDYIEKVVGTSPNNSKTGVNDYEASAFLHTNFKSLQTSIAAAATQEVATITFPTFAAGSGITTASLQDAALGASGSFYLKTSDGVAHTFAFNTDGQAAAATGISGSLTQINLPAMGAAISASGAQLATATANTITAVAGFTATAALNVVTITTAEAGNVLDLSTTFPSTTASAATTIQGVEVEGYGGIHSDREIILITQSADITYTSSFSEGYDHAVTPWITSQLQSGTSKNLIKEHTLVDGDSTNTDYKISVTNLREPSDIDNEEQYSTFSLLVRKYGDKDKTPIILEQYNNLTLDPDSPNYISRRVGDRFGQYNEALGVVEYKGNFPNISDYCRIEVAQGVEEKSHSPKLSPKGFRGVYNPIPTSSFSVNVAFPSASIKSTQTLGGVYNQKAYLGWKFDDENRDNINFLKPLPSTLEINVCGDFNVDSYLGHASSSWGGSLSASIDTTGQNGPTSQQLQFSVPFQGGLDGISPSTIIKTGQYLEAGNAFGFDLSSTGTAGYKGYKKALDILSNQDEYDINMLVIPGAIKSLHSSVTNAGIDLCESRGDTFYVMDLSIQEASVATAVADVAGLDTNYAAVYFPWVKVLDPAANKPVYVPPSVVVPGAIAASDRISAEWFAPAGLNRGVLGNVLEARQRLSQANRDRLYEDKINPIATFPQTGVCIWGQKTLQQRTTALDRINVRRLMIALKKFIASSSRYLVFEQNTFQTRNRFLNIVNPYLESVQSRQGLYAFRVQMDESNNTPDVIDRNQLVGQIFLQPTKTAEFIVLDFTVLPTGATFDA